MTRHHRAARGTPGRHLAGVHGLLLAVPAQNSEIRLPWSRLIIYSMQFFALKRARDNNMLLVFFFIFFKQPAQSGLLRLNDGSLGRVRVSAHPKVSQLWASNGCQIWQDSGCADLAQFALRHGSFTTFGPIMGNKGWSDLSDLPYVSFSLSVNNLSLF